MQPPEEVRVLGRFPSHEGRRQSNFRGVRTFPLAAFAKVQAEQFFQLIRLPVFHILLFVLNEGNLLNKVAYPPPIELESPTFS